MDVYRWMRLEWDRVAAVVIAIAGLAALIVGWSGVSNTGFPAEQMPYLASGVGLGLFALGVGATLWLSADLRDEWRKLEEIRQELAKPAAPDVKPAALEVAPAEERTIGNGSARPVRRPRAAAR